MGRDPMGERRKGGVRSGSHAADCPWMDAVGRLSARPQTKFGRPPRHSPKPIAPVIGPSSARS